MTNYQPMPKAELLREVFTYFPEDGTLYWNYRPNISKAANTRWAGKEAGSYDRGYLTVRLNGSLYFVHRIIYVMIYGDCLGVEDPIDHKDLDGCNNREDNLRKATHTLNNANKEAQSNNASGNKGIDRLPNGKYRTRVGGIHIGCYSTLEEAAKAYDGASYELYGEYRRVSLRQVQI